MRKLLVVVVLSMLVSLFPVMANAGVVSNMQLNENFLRGQVVGDHEAKNVSLSALDGDGREIYRETVSIGAYGFGRFECDVSGWDMLRVRKVSAASDTGSSGEFTLPFQLSIKPVDAVMRQGDVIQLELTWFLEHREENLTKNLTVGIVWSSSNESVVCPVAGGRFEAKSPGVAEIKAIYLGKEAKARVRVAQEYPLRKIANSELDRTFSPTTFLRLEPTALYAYESCKVHVHVPDDTDAKLVNVTFPVAGSYTDNIFMPTEIGAGWVTAIYELDEFHFIDKAWLEVISTTKRVSTVSPADNIVNWYFSCPNRVIANGEAEFKVSAPDGIVYKAYRGKIIGQRREANLIIITYQAPVINQSKMYDYITAYQGDLPVGETINVEVVSDPNMVTISSLAPWLIYLDGESDQTAKLETPLGPIIEKTTATATYGKITPSEFMPDAAGMFEFTYQAPKYRPGWDDWKFETVSGKTVNHGTWVQAKAPLSIWPEPEIVNTGGSSKVYGRFNIKVPAGTEVTLGTTVGNLAETKVYSDVNGEFSTMLTNITQLAVVDAKSTVISAAGNKQMFTAECEVKIRGEEEIPPIENLSDGTMVDRMPGYVPLTKPVKLAPGKEFSLTYDTGKMKFDKNKIQQYHIAYAVVPTQVNPEKDYHIRAYYWHDKAQKWVALATYSDGKGKVKVINDNNYKGWFMVFWVIQPNFTDVVNHWAEPVANRANGLGFLEGYPTKTLTRPAQLERMVTRAEFAVLTGRIIGLNPGDLMYKALKPISADEAEKILKNYSDFNRIPKWCKDVVGAMTKENMIRPHGNKLDANVPITRIEATHLVSRALEKANIPANTADLSGYKDSSKVPSWAEKSIKEGTIEGYPDGTLRPDNPIKRAEALTVLMRLLRNLGW